MERLVRLDGQRALGRSAFELFPALREAGDSRCYEEPLRGKSGRLRLVSLDGGNGRDRWLEGSYAPLYGPAADVVGGVAIVREMRRAPEEVAVGAGLALSEANGFARPKDPLDWLSYN